MNELMNKVEEWAKENSRRYLNAVQAFVTKGLRGRERAIVCYACPARLIPSTLLRGR